MIVSCLEWFSNGLIGTDNKRRIVFKNCAGKVVKVIFSIQILDFIGGGIGCVPRSNYPAIRRKQPGNRSGSFLQPIQQLQRGIIDLRQRPRPFCKIHQALGVLFFGAIEVRLQEQCCFDLFCQHFKRYFCLALRDQFPDLFFFVQGDLSG